MKLPPSGNWAQANKSDLFGSIARSKNIDLDERGYLKLSPRSVLVMSEADDADHGIPVAFGAYNTSNNNAANLLIMTTDAPFTFDPSDIAIAYTEDEGTGNPTGTIDSHAVFWIDRWHASTDTTVVSRSAASNSWTSRITSLTSGKTHFLEIFKSRNTICVANGNVVKQYDTSYAASIDLTIPSEFEITKLKYNNEKMAVVARLSQNTAAGVTDDTYFFVWNGATTAANQGVSIGSSGILHLLPYKGSFIIVTEAGQVKYWTGGGFQELANFPFYNASARLSRNVLSYGDTAKADGDVAYINIGSEVYTTSRKGDAVLPAFQAGMWCFDPEVGLYHRYSPSISQAYVVSVAAAGVNTTTDVITAATGTIPATGNVARYASLNASTAIGGLSINQDYYIIKVSSTTFKLATTKENAIEGIAIDLTAQSGATNYFWMYNVIDYGQTHYLTAGAVQIMPQITRVYDSLIMGANLYHTNLTEYSDACMTVPNLENRGYVIVSKLLAEKVEDNLQNAFIAYRPLKTNDAIIVKYKPRDVLGLPTVSPQTAFSTDEATWTAAREFYTSSDLSEAKTYLDAGGELELELIAGAGAGQMVKISSITSPSSGVTSVVVAEDVLGAGGSAKSFFIIDNWHTLTSVNSTTQDNSGVLDVSIGDKHKWTSLKIELRGSDTTIEGIHPVLAAAR